MRALCGAVMAAGAFVGLGLTAIGVGLRYQMVKDETGHVAAYDWHHLDPALLVIIILLVVAALTGIGVAFVGLMYHHERRHHERHGHAANPTMSPRVQV